MNSLLNSPSSLNRYFTFAGTRPTNANVITPYILESKIKKLIKSKKNADELLELKFQTGWEDDRIFSIELRIEKINVVEKLERILYKLENLGYCDAILYLNNLHITDMIVEEEEER